MHGVNKRPPCSFGAAVSYWSAHSVASGVCDELEKDGYYGGTAVVNKCNLGTNRQTTTLTSPPPERPTVFFSRAPLFTQPASGSPFHQKNAWDAPVFTINT